MAEGADPCLSGSLVRRTYAQMWSPLEHTIGVLDALTTDMYSFLQRQQGQQVIGDEDSERDGALTKSIALWSACVQDCLYALHRLPDAAPIVQTRARGDEVGAAVAEELTGRELEVLLLLARGLPVKEVARNLHVSEKTVRNHLGHIYHKLEMNDRTQLVIYAFKKGLIGLHDI